MALDIWPIEASMTAPLSTTVLIIYEMSSRRTRSSFVQKLTVSTKFRGSSEFTRPIRNYLAASPQFSYQPITHDELITFCSISRSLSADKSVLTTDWKIVGNSTLSYRPKDRRQFCQYEKSCKLRSLKKTCMWIRSFEHDFSSSRCKDKSNLLWITKQYSWSNI